jgi:hypothetical protein
MRLHTNKFGIADISTGKILDDLHHFKSVDYITKTLRSLRRKKYIGYEDRKGVRGSFNVRFDYWLGEGGNVWTLDVDGHYVLRGNNLSSGSSPFDVAPMLGAHSPMSDTKESIENDVQNGSSTESVVRGDKNDKEIEKEKEIYTSSTTLKREKRLTFSYVSKDDAEARCKEIALEVGDEYIDFILSALYHEYGGIEIIEEAFECFKETMRVADEKGDPIKNPPALFNRYVTDSIEGNKLEKSRRYE